MVDRFVEGAWYKRRERYIEPPFNADSFYKAVDVSPAGTSAHVQAQDGAIILNERDVPYLCLPGCFDLASPYAAGLIRTSTPEIFAEQPEGFIIGKWYKRRSRAGGNSGFVNNQYYKCVGYQTSGGDPKFGCFDGPNAQSRNGGWGCFDHTPLDHPPSADNHWPDNIRQLIDKVRGVDPAAADWLETDNPRKDYRSEHPCLQKWFKWSDTPQGWGYWKDLHEKVCPNPYKIGAYVEPPQQESEVRIPLRDKVYGKAEHEAYMEQQAHNAELQAALDQWKFGDMLASVKQYLTGEPIDHGPVWEEDE